MMQIRPSLLFGNVPVKAIVIAGSALAAVELLGHQLLDAAIFALEQLLVIAPLIRTDLV